MNDDAPEGGKKPESKEEDFFGKPVRLPWLWFLLLLVPFVVVILGVLFTGSSDDKGPVVHQTAVKETPKNVIIKPGGRRRNSR